VEGGLGVNKNELRSKVSQPSLPQATRRNNRLQTFVSLVYICKKIINETDGIFFVTATMPPWFLSHEPKSDNFIPASLVTIFLFKEHRRVYG
jgi:hypothetical protein